MLPPFVEKIILYATLWLAIATLGLLIYMIVKSVQTHKKVKAVATEKGADIKLRFCDLVPSWMQWATFGKCSS